MARYKIINSAKTFTTKNNQMTREEIIWRIAIFGMGMIAGILIEQFKKPTK